MRNNCLSGPKYCPRCGKELDTYDISCKFCGTSLIPYQNEDRQRKTSKKKKNT